MELNMSTIMNVQTKNDTAAVKHHKIYTMIQNYPRRNKAATVNFNLIRYTCKNFVCHCKFSPCSLYL